MTIKALMKRIYHGVVRRLKRSAEPPPAVAPPAVAVPPPCSVHVNDLLTHPMDGRVTSEYQTIPAIKKPLYFRSSICTAVDFRNEEFARWRNLIGEKPRVHRKIWEHVFIAAHLEAAGVLTPDHHGLGFGVGTEPLPAAFAALGARIMTTDMAEEDAMTAGWATTDQHARGLQDLNQKNLCPAEQFERLVSYKTCDMNAIDPDLKGFDFCWSSCSLEHLGSIRAGLDFIHASLDTLRPGGIAVHTTEYNISSNEHTIDNNPALVLFRRGDIELLVEELKAAGHGVADVCFDVLSEPVDLHVDLPPYTADTHIRLLLGNYVSSSIGVVIQKKRT